MKILVAEDEKKVLNFVRQALESAAMVVDTVDEMPELLTAIKTNTYDVAVLDRLLKNQDVLDSLLQIRAAAPSMRILILSALNEMEEKVRGLSEGADDYLGKPFHVAELVARVRSLGRRSHETGKHACINFEDLLIDLEKHRVTRSGQRIDVTGKELKILCLFAKKPGHVFSKTEILDLVWDINHDPESNVVEVTIANLRAKLDKGRKPLIQSRRGMGYWIGEAD